jgi:CRP-like cAMP-binding protein
MKRAEAAKIMSSHGWLTRTDERFRREVLGRSQLILVKKGGLVMEEGAEPGALIGIVEGSVKMQVSPEHSGPVVSGISTAGYWYGEYSFITGEPRLARGEAASERVVALFLQKRQLDAILAEEPQRWRWIAYLSAQTTRATVNVASTLLIKDNYRRVCAVLNRLVETENGEYAVACRHEDLADMCSLSRHTVMRVVSQLLAKNIVRTEYGRLVITNIAALRNEAGR